jgi:hypothetical protein
MDWKQLLERAESLQERQEIVRMAMFSGVPKHEIEAHLEAMEHGEKRVFTTGPQIRPEKDQSKRLANE